MRQTNYPIWKIIWALIKISSYRRILLLTVGSLAGFVSGVMIPIRGLIFASYYDGYDQFIKRESSGDLVVTAWVNLYYYSGLIAVVASFLQIVLWEFANDELVTQLKNGFFAQALRMDASWHDALAAEDDLSTTLSEDIENIRNTLGTKMSFALAATSSLVGAFLACLYFSTEFFLLAVVGSVVMIGFTLMMGRISARMAGKEQQKFREVGSVVGEVLSSMRTVKSYNTETEELSRFGQIVRSGKKLATRKNLILAALASFNNSFLLILFSSVIAVGAYLMRYEGLSLGNLIGTIFSTMLGFFSFMCTLSIVGDITSAISCCSNLLALMKLNPLIDPDSKQDTRVDNLEGDIVFKDVTFSYPTRRNVKVLKGINLTIPRGKTVALVGPSGSGKSTVLSLILRFFDADAGEISIGTNRIRDTNVKDLRRKIGVVSQEPVLFDGTVEDNIHYGNLEASLDEIKFAAQMTNAHDFIMSLPEAYKTIVGERGAMLSGGQKQRVAIARALIRRPDILLLDEASSALDSLSEKVVQQTLESVSAGRTTVAVAHRLSSIKYADLIYVMMDGRIAEKGTHEDLMRARGAYFMLYSQQNAYEASNTLENGMTREELVERIINCACEISIQHVHIQKATQSLQKRAVACIRLGGGIFENLINDY